MTSPHEASAPADLRTRNVPGAILWMLGSVTFFSLVAIAAREASRTIPTTELMFWRAAGAFLIILAIVVALRKRPADLKTGRPVLQTGRTVVHFAAQFSWIHALTLIPLVEVFALEFTSPLWVAVLAPLLLGERLTRWRIAAAAIGFAGALVVIRPFGAGGMSLSAGSALALASALGFAINIMATRVLAKTDTPLVLLFWMNGIQLAMGSMFMLDGFARPEGMAWVWLGMLTASGLAAHYSLTRAIRLADSIVVAPMDFVRLPLIAAVGFLVYREPLSVAVLAGGALIVLGNLVNLAGERRR
jgi:drug/metabolite transporter (DMT)-like permease